MCSNDGSEFGGSIYQKVSDCLETAVNLAWTAGSNSTRFGIAAKYKLDCTASISVSMAITWRSVQSTVYFHLLWICVLLVQNRLGGLVGISVQAIIIKPAVFKFCKVAYSKVSQNLAVKCAYVRDPTVFIKRRAQFKKKFVSDSVSLQIFL